VVIAITLLIIISTEPVYREPLARLTFEQVPGQQEAMQQSTTRALRVVSDLTTTLTADLVVMFHASSNKKGIFFFYIFLYATVFWG
jgi:hypothetical protein